jgi:hypothetical protein
MAKVAIKSQDGGQVLIDKDLLLSYFQQPRAFFQDVGGDIFPVDGFPHATFDIVKTLVWLCNDDTDEPQQLCEEMVLRILGALALARGLMAEQQWYSVCAAAIKRRYNAFVYEIDEDDRLLETRDLWYELIDAQPWLLVWVETAGQLQEGVSSWLIRDFIRRKGNTCEALAEMTSNLLLQLHNRCCSIDDACKLLFPLLDDCAVDVFPTLGGANVWSRDVFKVLKVLVVAIVVLGASEVRVAEVDELFERLVRTVMRSVYIDVDSWQLFGMCMLTLATVSYLFRSDLMMVGKHLCSLPKDPHPLAPWLAELQSVPDGLAYIGAAIRSHFDGPNLGSWHKYFGEVCAMFAKFSEHTEFMENFFVFGNGDYTMRKHPFDGISSFQSSVMFASVVFESTPIVNYVAQQCNNNAVWGEEEMGAFVTTYITAPRFDNKAPCTDHLETCMSMLPSSCNPIRVWPNASLYMDYGMKWEPLEAAEEVVDFLVNHPFIDNGDMANVMQFVAMTYMDMRICEIVLDAWKHQMG